MKVSYILNRENNNLDLIRIVLACMVILGHSPFLNGSSRFWFDPISLFFSYTYSGSFAVKMFFFISGLVVTNSLITQKSAIKFIIARIFRILPALFFVLLLTVLVFGSILTSHNLSSYFLDKKILSYFLDHLIFSNHSIDSLPGVFENNIFKNKIDHYLPIVIFVDLFNSFVKKIFILLSS